MSAMSEAEVTIILSIIKAAYPSGFKGISKKDAQATINLWTMQLADAPFAVVYLAVQQLISTSTFPPTIAEIRKQVVKIRSSASEAICQAEQSIRWNAYDGNLLTASNEEAREVETALAVTERERTPYQLQTAVIYELTKDFKEEPALYTLMQNADLQRMVEDSQHNVTLPAMQTNGRGWLK
jgi:hypothetical protein